MNKKLTLSVDDKVVERAKVYAKNHNTSISQLVEQYLGEITSTESLVLTGTVSELAGIISEVKEDRIDYLDKKYS